MKETAELIYNNFSHINRGQKKGYNLCSLFTLHKILLSYKQELISGLATLGIGSIFLFSIYLFFIQLAECGW